MCRTEYGDSLAYSKYPSDNRSTHRSDPVTCRKLRNRTTHLLLFTVFAVALTFIMLFTFNLRIRPSLFIHFSSPLQCHSECFSERVQQINMCDASFNRKMSPLRPPRSVITDYAGHTGHVNRFRFTCRRKCERVCIASSCQRNKRTFGNDDRQEWSMGFDGKNT